MALQASQQYHDCPACEQKTVHRLRYICTEHSRALQSEINALEEYVEGDGDPGCDPLSVAVLLGFVERLRAASLFNAHETATISGCIRKRIAALPVRDLWAIAERAVESFRDDGSDIPERIRWKLQESLARNGE